ncbi:pectate lyase family protein [Cognataquiflexum aquatile]|uniref:pectate lyase family protein n=1 Tax=Cognataquiflexum aquatile TaxID=2249427 RepID=UPI000DEAA402|nr:pectate lyase [Cognataquiflexum aquatile]
MIFILYLCLLQSLGTFTSPSQDVAKPLAFPGAEGFGKYATGGRGGMVYIVTNLNDSGLGSLRWAVEAKGPRTVIFQVSGNVELKSNLNIREGNLTIAGQTAPGEGITIKNHSLIIRNASNIIIRFIRSRLGDTSNLENDAFTIRRDSRGSTPENIIIDHCSFSWGTDETLSIGNGKNITIQYCIIAEGLNDSVHEKGPHGYGGIVSGQNISIFTNLLSHFTQRNLHFQKGNNFSRSESLIDFRNNAVYNWSFRASDGGYESNVNIISNYYKPGPASQNTGGHSNHFFNGTSINKDPNTYGLIFLEGNILTNRKEVTDNQWLGVRLQSGTLTKQYLEKLKHKDQKGKLIPFSIQKEFFSKTYPADVAYTQILNHSGSSLFRDAVDLRLINEVKTGKTTYMGSKTGIPGIIDSQNDVGGWPELKSLPAPKDSDRDGMPDAWEIENGLDPDKRSDRFYDLNPNFTNLEVYLNGLVAHLFDF